MVDEIAKIMGNLIQIAQTGKVDKVKEVTPRPEEGRNMPSPFSEIALSTHREKGKGQEKKKNIRSSSNLKQIDEGGEDERKIDVVI
ncbi:MAG: hypothetical protein HZC45_06870 [Deltaproteobacteria bacterium]|nr:hypothetical protein [Deltaproteobacteria bacterium]